MYKHNKHFRSYGNLKQVLYLLQLSFISINVSMKVSFHWVEIDLWLRVRWTEGRCSKIKLNKDTVGFVYKYIYLALGNFMNNMMSAMSNLITVPLKHLSSVYLFFDTTLCSGETFFSRLDPDALRWGGTVSSSPDCCLAKLTNTCKAVKQMSC